MGVAFLLICTLCRSKSSSFAVMMTSMKMIVKCTCGNVSAVLNHGGQWRHPYMHTMKLLVRISHSWEAKLFTLLSKFGSYSLSVSPKLFETHIIMKYVTYSCNYSVIWKKNEQFDWGKYVETATFVPSWEWNGLSLLWQPVTMAKVHSRTSHFNHWTLPSPYLLPSSILMQHEQILM